MPELTVIPHANDSTNVDGLNVDGERSWTVLGTENPTTAIAKVATVAPAALIVSGGYGVRTKWKTTLVEGIENCMIVTAIYAPEEGEDGSGENGKPPPTVGEWEFQGNVISRSLKLQRARETIKRGGIQSFNDFSKAIGWDGKKIHGVEWPSGHCQIQIKSYFYSHALTVDLLKSFNSWIGYVNSDDNWLGIYDKGEARFLGAQIDQVIPYASTWPSKPASATFSFDISPNGNVTIPTEGFYWEGTDPHTDTIAKEGWDLLDVYSVTKYDEKGIPTPTPIYANILRVAPRVSFATTFGWNGSNRRGAGVPTPP